MAETRSPYIYPGSVKVLVGEPKRLEDGKVEFQVAEIGVTPDMIAIAEGVEVKPEAVASALGALLAGLGSSRKVVV